MMPTIASDFSERSLDAIREMGNIGAGNAMTALATIADDRVGMEIPWVGIVPTAEFAGIVGGPEEVVVCVYMAVEGDAPGHVAFLVPLACASRLADRAMGRAQNRLRKVGAMERSALMEIGNIVASSYVVALGDMTGLRMLSSPPAIAIETAAAILCSMAVVLEPTCDKAMTIITRIGEPGGVIEGFVLYIPEPGSLTTIVRALQMEG